MLDVSGGKDGLLTWVFQASIQMRTFQTLLLKPAATSAGMQSDTKRALQGDLQQTHHLVLVVVLESLQGIATLNWMPVSMTFPLC